LLVFVTLQVAPDRTLAEAHALASEVEERSGESGRPPRSTDRVEDGDQGNSDEGGKDLASWPPNASRGKRGRRIGLALFLRLGASASGLRLIYG
jgi:hypothetical protein